MARWTTGVFGLAWLDELVRNGKAADLGGNGYPCRYSVSAGVLLPLLSRGLPANDSPPVFGDDYVLPAGWNGELEVDSVKCADCPGDEILLVEAWDQS